MRGAGLLACRIPIPGAIDLSILTECLLEMSVTRV